MRPYISLDVETTGVNLDRSELLEIGWVVDDGTSPVEELISRNFIIARNTISYGEFFALDMNARIFKALKEGHPDIQLESFIARQLLMDMLHAAELAVEWDKFHGLFVEGKPNRKIQMAGKNYSGFDGIFVNGLLVRTDRTKEFAQLAQHRVMDVGPMYAHDFGYVPSLPEICKKHMNNAPVTHKAVEDAQLVVSLIRNKLTLG